MLHVVQSCGHSKKQNDKNKLMEGEGDGGQTKKIVQETSVGVSIKQGRLGALTNMK